MSTSRQCPECGATLPEDFSGGCPVCALRGALELSGAEAAAVVAEKPGDQVGRYKLLEKIGEGGCGVVYLAEQSEPIRRQVALKVVKLGMDTKQVITRFEAERQALALMDHPHIAKVLDAGSTEAGRPFFVMELVRGVKITDYCDQNQLSTRERLDLFMQVCHAVQHAHQKGIIHRDLKPSNILVTLHDGVPVPKVIDFGIAKATAQQRLTDKTLFTAFQQFLGTPAYMSPEQAQMSGLDIDTRSDIYSLGVLLYELLTSQLPFEAQALLHAGLDEMRRVIREQEPPKPSTKLSTLTVADLTNAAKQRHIEPPKLIHVVRGDLDWIVMKCLEKDRTRRYATADALAEDLGHHLHHEPVSAVAPGRWYRVSKFVRRHRAGVTTAVAVTLLLSILLGVTLNLRSVSQHDKDEARMASTFLSVWQELLSHLELSVGQDRNTPRRQEILNSLDDAAKRADTDLKDLPGVQAAFRLTISQAYGNLGEYSKAEVLLRKQLAIARKPDAMDNEVVIGSLTELAYILGAQGNSAKAEPLLREALSLRKMSQGSNPADVAGLLDSLASVLSDEGKLDEAEGMGREALALQKKLLGSENTNVAMSLIQLASEIDKQGEWTEEEEMLREALAILKKTYGAKSEETANSLPFLGLALANQGKLTESERTFREALTMQKKLLGNENPHVAQSLEFIGMVLGMQGKWGDAETMSREGLAMQKKLLGGENEHVAEALDLLADALSKQGKNVDAETTLREALAIRKKLLGNENERVAFCLNNLATVLMDEGKLNEAETMVRETLAMRKKLYGNVNLYVGQSLEMLVRVLVMEGNAKEAEATQREEVSVQNKLPRNEHPERAKSLTTNVVSYTAGDYYNLSDAKFGSGDYAGASADLNRAIKLKPAFVLAYYSRGTEKIRQKDIAGAVADFDKVIQLNTNFAAAYFLRGAIAAAQGESEGPIADFTKAIALNPKYAEAYMLRGGAKQRKHDYNGAIVDFNKAIELNPNDPGAYDGRGHVKFEKKDNAGAINDFDKAIELKSDDPELYLFRGYAKAKRSDDYDGAIFDLTKAIELKPSLARTNFGMAYATRGTLKTAKGDFGGAIADCTKAIELNPGDAEAYNYRGDAKGIQGDLDGAIADFNKATELKPDYAEAYHGRGRMKEAKGDFGGAMTDYGKAAERGSADIQYRVGLMLYEGKLVPRDNIEGGKWIMVAAGAGNSDAKRLLKEIELFLTADELAEAQKRAAAFNAAHAAQYPK